MILLNETDAPIGVFDSGLGGLTVVQALQRSLPREKIIYYGDTLHLPYGDKGKEEISSYANQIITFLKREGVKFVFIACNSATSALFKKRALLPLNIVEPFAFEIKRYLEDRSKLWKIGLVGTKLTVDSHIFEHLIYKEGIMFYRLRTPKLVPMIENNLNSRETVFKYLARFPIDLDFLLLGCTHYPWIRGYFEEYCLIKKISVLDATAAAINAITQLLREENLFNNSNFPGSVTLYWSKFNPLIQRFVEQLDLNVEWMGEKNIFEN